MLFYKPYISDDIEMFYNSRHNFNETTICKVVRNDRI